MPIDLPNELTELRRQILVMGAEVEQRVKMAVDALINRDRDLAKRVRKGDDEIDQMDVDIEQERLRILALSQPVAGDLRFVLTVLRIGNELERVGDLARSLAKRVNDLAKLPPIEVPDSILTMSRETRRMLEEALTALSDEDPGLARRVRLSDDRVDDLLKEAFRWTQAEIPVHVDSTRAALDMLSVARKLERIADHATNIAEEVIFLVEGTLVRHADG